MILLLDQASDRQQQWLGSRDAGVGRVELGRRRRRGVEPVVDRDRACGGARLRSWNSRTASEMAMIREAPRMRAAVDVAKRAEQVAVVVVA